MAWGGRVDKNLTCFRHCQMRCTRHFSGVKDDPGKAVHQPSKQALFAALHAHLEAQLASTMAASRDAAAYATDEESRADSKWDTQGLEASYLAAGQASLARELAAAQETLRAHRPAMTMAQGAVGVGAFVCCEIEGSVDCYYLVPVAGGIGLTVEGTEVTTVSLQTPVGRALRGKRAGESYQLPNGLGGKITSVA